MSSSTRKGPVWGKPRCFGGSEAPGGGGAHGFGQHGFRDDFKRPARVVMVLVGGGGASGTGLSSTRTQRGAAGSHSSTQLMGLHHPRSDWAKAAAEGSSSARAARSRVIARFMPLHSPPPPFEIAKIYALRTLRAVPKRLDKSLLYPATKPFEGVARGLEMVALVRTVAYLAWRRRAGRSCSARVATGLPRFTLARPAPDKAVERSSPSGCRPHFVSHGPMALPPKRITINLSPADLPKADRITTAARGWPLLGQRWRDRLRAAGDVIVVGELALDGGVVASPGVLIAARHASEAGAGA